MEEGNAPPISSTPAPPHADALDERKLQQEASARTRELDLREREVAAKERELATRWRSPIVIGLLAASVGFVANLVVAYLNNRNTLQVERQRSQSNIVLEAIRTGNNTDAVCKNLVFFVGLGLVDDANQTILKQCRSAPTGPPSLPASSSTGGYGLQPFGQGPFGGTTADNLNWLATPHDLNWIAMKGYVVDADTGSPIADAKVTVGTFPAVQTNPEGFFPMPQGVAGGTELDTIVEKSGYDATTVRVRVGSLFSIAMHRKK